MDKLLDRLNKICPFTERLKKAIKEYPQSISHTKRVVAKTCLYWHFLEIQLIRWDLRSISHSTASSWRTIFHEEKLGWQVCWQGEESILKEIKGFISDRLKEAPELATDSENEEEEREATSHFEDSSYSREQSI